MPPSELATEQIIKKVRNLMAEVKKMERGRSELLGKKEALHERLQKELGFKTVKEARESAKKKEDLITKNEKKIRDKFGELEERKEWALLIAKA